jgi:hypothetical protein
MPFLYVHRLVAKCVSKRANSFENKEKKGRSVILFHIITVKWTHKMTAKTRYEYLT